MGDNEKSGGGVRPSFQVTVTEDLRVSIEARGLNAKRLASLCDVLQQLLPVARPVDDGPRIVLGVDLAGDDSRTAVPEVGPDGTEPASGESKPPSSESKPPPSESNGDGSEPIDAEEVEILSSALQLRAVGFSWTFIGEHEDVEEPELLPVEVEAWAKREGISFPPKAPSDKILKGYRMRVYGVSWREVAKAAGYPNGNSACASIKTAAQARELPWPVPQGRSEGDEE